MQAVITIFTPTYNRAYLLHRCYESLKNQTSKDFIWLIIDDGSTDNTKDMVESWISEGLITIIYHYQENQGMHGAHNTAYELINTELNVCIDSDDYMPEDAVENIVVFWEKYRSDKVSGIVALDVDINGNVIGTSLPDRLKKSKLFDLYHVHGVTGDKKLVYRTDLTRRYPYPVFQDEKYVGLTYKYYKLDEEFPMLLLNKTVCIVEYMADGSTKNMFKQYRNNPKGFSFFRKELMKLPYATGMFKFRQAVHYVSSSIMLGNRKFLEQTPNKLLTLLALPIGFLLYVYVSFRQM